MGRRMRRCCGAEKGGGRQSFYVLLLNSSYGLNLVLPFATYALYYNLLYFSRSGANVRPLDWSGEGGRQVRQSPPAKSFADVVRMDYRTPANHGHPHLHPGDGTGLRKYSAIGKRCRRASSASAEIVKETNFFGATCIEYHRPGGRMINNKLLVVLSGRFRCSPPPLTNV
jgi:hypothetical protein